MIHWLFQGLCVSEDDLLDAIAEWQQSWDGRQSCQKKEVDNNCLEYYHKKSVHGSNRAVSKLIGLTDERTKLFVVVAF